MIAATSSALHTFDLSIAHELEADIKRPVALSIVSALASGE